MVSHTISATEEKNSIIVYDCTGAFSYANKGGYGLPNAKLEDFFEAYFEVKPPSWKEGQDPIKVDVYPSFPSTDEFGFEVLPHMLNMKEIESGEYKIKYITKYKDKKGATFTQSAMLTLFCMNSITCCIDKKQKQVRAGGFGDPRQKLIIELSNLLQSVNYQIDCGNYGIANEDLEYLKAQCNCCGCS